MTRSDNLSGSVVSAIGTEPPVIDKVSLKVNLFESVVGSETNEDVKPIAINENILLTIGTATTVGRVLKIAKKGIVEFEIKSIIAVDPDSKVAISRQFNKRWRLIGWCEIASYNEVPVKVHL